MPGNITTHFNTIHKVYIYKKHYVQVVSTCKTDAVPILESYGIEAVIDYTSPDYARDIKTCGP
jgi:hypothetical protein